MWIQCHIEIKIQIVYKSVSGDTFQFGRRTDWATQMRHMWQHELNILKQTSHWQQVLTETWNWHNMDSAANNDALYIASSVTPLSLVSTLLSADVPWPGPGPWPAHEAIIRTGSRTWHLRQKLGAGSVSSPPPPGAIGQSEARMGSGDQSEGEPSTCLSRLKVSHY